MGGTWPRSQWSPQLEGVARSKGSAAAPVAWERRGPDILVARVAGARARRPDPHSCSHVRAAYWYGHARTWLSAVKCFKISELELVSALVYLDYHVGLPCKRNCASNAPGNVHVAQAQPAGCW